MCVGAFYLTILSSTGTEMTTRFQNYATLNGYTPANGYTSITSLGIDNYAGFDANFIPLPTSQPSSIPSSIPTAPSSIPTSIPTAIPTSIPTSMPSISAAPTVVLDHIEVGIPLYYT